MTPCAAFPVQDKFGGLHVVVGPHRTEPLLRIRGHLRSAAVVVSLVLALPLAAQTPAGRYQAPVVTDTGDLKGPRQPIFFRHDIHAGEGQIPCMYCHYSAAVSSEPGIPSLQTCLGCHVVVSGGTRAGLEGDTAAAQAERAQIQQLRTAWRDRKPPEWIRIHALPGFVRFPHQRHIKAFGAQSCSKCHGDVQRMPQVYQVETLRMGWCVRCHVENKVSRDCSVCHY